MRESDQPMRYFGFKWEVFSRDDPGDEWFSLGVFESDGPVTAIRRAGVEEPLVQADGEVDDTIIPDIMVEKRSEGEVKFAYDKYFKRWTQ